MKLGYAIVSQVDVENTVLLSITKENALYHFAMIDSFKIDGLDVEAILFGFFETWFLVWGRRNKELFIS